MRVNQRFSAIKHHRTIFSIHFLHLFSLFQYSSSLSMHSSSQNRVVKLNYYDNRAAENASVPNIVNAKAAKLPPTLFLHGLDSSSHTWRNVLDEVNSRAVALDLRGCGTSPLADPNDFSSDAIVDDIHSFLCSHPYFNSRKHVDVDSVADADKKEKIDIDVKENKEIIPFVIAGHSMGGRIAMSFAARYPELVKALVIEDMDVRTRPMEMNAFQSNDRDGTVNFNRLLECKSEREVIECFEKEGYPENSVRKWLKEGRVELRNDGSYYSGVNPAFRILCYEEFFVTSHGEDTWMNLAKQTDFDFPIHVMVADKDKTVCDEESLRFMKDTMKKGGKFMVMHRYKNATHSVHNSARSDFVKDLTTIIKTASLVK